MIFTNVSFNFERLEMPLNAGNAAFEFEGQIYIFKSVLIQECFNTLLSFGWQKVKKLFRIGDLHNESQRSND